MALYRLVSGSSTHDKEFHQYTHDIFESIFTNRGFPQKTAGVETITGRYHAGINLKALMVLELHDSIFKTNYSIVRKDVFEMINTKLKDPETGLYYEYYQTGLLGYKDEILAETEAWSTKEITPHVNSNVIFFLNHFDRNAASVAWEKYKAMFGEKILSMSVEEISATGNSYTSALSPSSEAYICSMLAAKEMEDRDFFEKLLKNLNELSAPRLSESKIWFDNFKEKQDIVGFYIQLAKVHVGWDKIFCHNWSDYYKYTHNSPAKL